MALGDRFRSGDVVRFKWETVWHTGIFINMTRPGRWIVIRMGDVTFTVHPQDVNHFNKEKNE